MRDYWAGRTEGWGAAHYIIDDVETVRTIPEDEVAPAVGGDCLMPYLDGEPWHGYSRQNALTLSIELMPDDAEGRFHGLVYSRAVALTREIVQRYRLGTEQVLRHYDVTGKDCPKRWVDEPAEWNEFRREVMNGVRKGRILP